jgi:hypothetical protein
MVLPGQAAPPARDATGSPAAPIYVAGGMLLVAMAALLGFRFLQKSARPAAV